MQYQQQWSDVLEDSPEYTAFVEKFKPKKTTDDCYTPPPVYDAVAEWVEAEYGLNRASFVRPFYPGGDYENYDYPADCVVVDNPPFSILSKIVRFYIGRGVRFFLFSPYLRTAGVLGTNPKCCCVAAGADVTYENGAKVKTSFLTNLDTCKARSAPDLHRLVEAASAEYQRSQKKELPKYKYPPHVLTESMLGYMSTHGVDFRVDARDVSFTRALDDQKAHGKGIYGSGFLLSEKAAAEKAAAIEWKLSDREWEIIRGLEEQKEG